MTKYHIHTLHHYCLDSINILPLLHLERAYKYPTRPISSHSSIRSRSHIFYVAGWWNFTSRQHLRLYQDGNSAYSWRLYTAALLGDQVTSIMTWYPIQSHYPGTTPNRPCPILIMSNAWLWSDKYTNGRSPKPGDGRSTHLAIQSGPYIAGSDCNGQWRINHLAK